MAGASHPSDGERVFNRAQLKLNLNLPSIDSPRSLAELQSIAQEIQHQKNEVLCHLKHEDKDRHSYFTQLEHLARQMRELPLPTDSPSLEYELERKRLELETQQMQETMQKTLGPANEVLRRREERILHLRKLDQKLAEVNGLIAQHMSKAEAAANDHCHTASSNRAREWDNDKDIWMSGSSMDLQLEDRNGHSDTASVMSFTSSIHSSHGAAGNGGSGNALLNGRANKVPMGPKVEVVYNLLTMLFSHDRHNVSKKLLHMSTNAETRNTLHQVGCIPLLVQLIYNQDGTGDAQQQQERSNHWILSEADKETRASAAQALRNLVINGSDDRKVKREMRILKLLDFIRDYADRLRDAIMQQLGDREEFDHRYPLLEEDEMDGHPSGVVTNLMKLSFDDDHRQAMSHLGALQGLSELLHMDQLAHGSLCDDLQCTTLRRYASMTLTNLTFGHGPNKSLLCSTRPLLSVLSHQLASPNDDLRQVTASVLRNLSWRADAASKDALQVSGIVRSLVVVAMETHRESTLKSILSALWNVSSHSNGNKATICSVPGALEFLVRTLSYKSESKTLSIVESGGGTLRNISSQITGRDDYRAILRQNNCFQVLLHHLRSPSLTVVSNACGTLWNLSARCKEDQAALRELGAVPMLRSLVHSRHKMIATASSAALKNLDSAALGYGGVASPLGTGSNTSLQARKQKALEQEIDQTLTEMCDNIDPLSPLEDIPPGVSPFDRRMYRSLGGHNTSQYGRMQKCGPNPMRPARSSSLERKNNGASGPVQPPSVVNPRMQTSRTAWRSHENETSYSSINYEEEDEPINYSLKYTEEVGSVPAAAARWTPSRPSDRPVGNTNEDPDVASAEEGNIDPTVKKALVLSAYRETDLDEPEHPTNFSLRYQEDEDYTADSDTMQTYCMEGTPYETPFIQSSAASLTDLREAGLEDGPSKDAERKPLKKEEPTGQEESLQEAEETADSKLDEKEDEDKMGKTPPLPRRPAQSNTKTVTFNTTADSENNYAEQTPLMFSRSSSLASLDSLDQQQAHDEGSVVSEFSRLTSRAVSPSELPDSPGQTMPSSPRRPHPVQPPRLQPQPKPLPPPRLMQQQQPQQSEDVFADATNNFLQEGTPAFTRAASPLSELSFHDEPSSPTPPPPLLPPIMSRPPMPLPPTSKPVPNCAPPPPLQAAHRANPDREERPLAHPAFSRVMKSSSEVNFRSSFDYDEARNFNMEDSPSLTRCTSLSSLHIDGEVISTAKLLPPSQAVGNLASAHLPDRKANAVKIEPAAIPAIPEPDSVAAEWSEESGGSDDDHLLEDIITMGMPSSRQQVPPSAKQKAPSASSLTAAHSNVSTFRPVPKSASAHTLNNNSRDFSAPSAPSIPPSQSTDSALSKGIPPARHSETDEDDDDDEMLYACIKSAKPTVKPLAASSKSSTATSLSSAIPPATNGVQQRSRLPRPPMELPTSKPPASKERVPPLHGPFSNVRQTAVRAKSTSEVPRSSGRRSRHSSQGSSRLGASGCSNNTSVDLDYRYSYKVEDTPVTFSRNSSLSSLSVNSNDDEPSAEDQALLDSCISWGMPKSKSDSLSRTDGSSKQTRGKASKSTTSSASTSQGSGLPTSQSWGGGVRRAGDGQASASASSASVTATSSAGSTVSSAAIPPSPLVDPSDVGIKMEEPEPMTHSSLIRIEANQVAAQIQQLEASSQPPSLSNDVDQQASLLSLSFIDGASNWGVESQRKSPSLSRKAQPEGSKRTASPANPLLKQALSSGAVKSGSENMAASSAKIDTSPDVQQESVTSLTCSVLDPTYFDDEQRREGLLTQLAILEQTVDENANTDNNSATSSPTEKRKLTPRDRRQMDKERYQTYTLNANGDPIDESASATNATEDGVKRTIKQRRSDERFKTQTIWSSTRTNEDITEKADVELGEKMMRSLSASELSTLDRLEMDAKAVIHTLKEGAKLSRKNSNSSEFNSEPYDLLDCETISLVSNESESDRSLCMRVRKLSLQQDGIENGTEFGDARRTRIVRPEDKIMQLDEANVKGIRGRRRVLCPVRVAPANNGPNRPATVQTPTPASTTTTTPPKNTIVIRTSSQSRGRSASPASPSPVRPNRTSALRQNSTHPQKAKAAAAESLTPVRLRPNSKSPRISSAPCSPRQPPQVDEAATPQQLKRRSLEVTAKVGSYQKSSPPKSESVNLPVDPQHPPLATLGKQGTFTKEKSSTSPEAPKEDEQGAVKVPPKVPPKPKLPLAKPALPKKPARFNNGPSPLSSPRSKGSPALSRRSVSSASIGSDSTVATTCSGMDETASATPPLKRTPPKKIVASKIASLWKQVEESRNKEKNAQPDSRKWISRGDSAKPLTEDKAVGPGVNSPVQQSESGQQRPLVSSGTFEKLSSFSNTPLPVISDKKSPPSRLPFRLPRFGRSNSSSASTTPVTPTLPTPPSPSFESGGQEAEDKRKFRVTAL